jgi:hypothetical protein
MLRVIVLPDRLGVGGGDTGVPPKATEELRLLNKSLPIFADSRSMNPFSSSPVVRPLYRLTVHAIFHTPGSSIAAFPTAGCTTVPAVEVNSVSTHIG